MFHPLYPTRLFLETVDRLHDQTLDPQWHLVPEYIDDLQAGLCGEFQQPILAACSLAQLSTGLFQ